MNAGGVVVDGSRIECVRVSLKQFLNLSSTGFSTKCPDVISLYVLVSS